MLWMMLPCLLLAGILLFGGNTFASSGYLWLIVVGVCVVPHIWMMFKGQGGHKDDDMEDKVGDTSAKHLDKKDEDNKHKSGGCCH